MPEEEKSMWKADSVNDKLRYEQELLALAQSDVANTATSIVMEERLNKMKLNLKSYELDNMLAERPTSTSMLSNVENGLDTHPKKKRRGKYKKRSNSPSHDLNTNTAVLSTAVHPENKPAPPFAIQNSNWSQRGNTVGSTIGVVDNSLVNSDEDLSRSRGPRDFASRNGGGSWMVHSDTNFARDSENIPTPMVGLGKSTMTSNELINQDDTAKFDDDADDVKID